MPEALSVLEMQYKKKMEFTKEFTAFKATPLSSPCDKEGTNWNEGSKLFCTCKAVMFQPLGGRRDLCLKLQMFEGVATCKNISSSLLVFFFKCV